jgi:DNA modification methylase
MKLINADCIQAMKEMAENSIDSIVTDPPYELGFMGKKWDSSGIAFNVEVWQQALRVLKPGGHLLAFSGSRTYHRMVVAIEDAGFEIRDQIMWIYGSGFPKSHDVSKAIDKAAGAERERIKYKGGIASGQGNYGGNGSIHDGTKVGNKAKTPQAQQWQGWGTALKPAHEPIVVARKPLIGTVAENVLEHGVGGLNIDGCRIAGEVPSKPQPILGNKERVTYGGGLGRNGEMSQSSLGRWPANIIFDEQAAELLDEQSGTHKPSKGRTGKVGGQQGLYENGHSPDYESTWPSDNGGGASRFFYCAKASKRDRNEGLDDFVAKEVAAKGNGLARTCATCKASTLQGCDCPDRTFINPSRANHHPTVKPTSLMRYLARLVTPPNGLVLDPFMGSGSTGKACALENFDFVGIELNAEYIKICKARIENALQDKEQQQELF